MFNVTKGITERYQRTLTITCFGSSYFLQDLLDNLKKFGEVFPYWLLSYRFLSVNWYHQLPHFLLNSFSAIHSNLRSEELLNNCNQRTCVLHITIFLVTRKEEKIGKGRTNARFMSLGDHLMPLLYYDLN